MVHIPFAAAVLLSGIARPLGHTRLPHDSQESPGPVRACLLAAVSCRQSLLTAHHVVGFLGELTGGRGGVAQLLNLNDHVRANLAGDVHARPSILPSPMRSSLAVPSVMRRS